MDSADRAASAASADVVELLTTRGVTLATAESLTGGALAARITDVPGASRVFRGGVVAYASDLKQHLLDVPTALVEEHGVVSVACARAMAEGARTRLGASYAVSTTGVAGPDHQEGKPPGTVYVGLAGPEGTTALSLELTGDRAAVRDQTCEAALSALLRIVRGEEPGLG